MCEWGSVDAVYIKAKNKAVDVDSCIAPLVEKLNDAGFETVASCCGHGKRPGNIALADGRELIIASNFEQARFIDSMFPVDIQGDPINHI